MKKLLFISTFLALLCSVSSEQFFSIEEALLAHTPQDQIISHAAYNLKYNEQYEQAECVVYFLTRECVKGKIDRTDDYRPDPNEKNRFSIID